MHDVGLDLVAGTRLREHATSPVRVGLSTDRLLVVLAALSGLGAALVSLAATSRGPGMSPDSTEYLSAGLNLAAGGGLRSFTGAELTIFPPGLPVVVAVGHWVGLSTSWTVRLFNAGAFATTVWLGFVLLRRHVRSMALVAGATALLAVSGPLLAMAEMAWTEPVFIAIALALILVLEDACEAGHPARLLALAAVVAWVGFMFRYAGIALIPAGGVSVLLGRRARGWRHASASAVSFVMAASAVPLLWMARNHLVDGTFLGPRAPSTDSVPAVVGRFELVLGEWVLPGLSAAHQRLVGMAVAIVCVALVVVVLLTSRAGKTRDPVGHDTSAGVGRSPVPLLCFTGAYAAYVVAAQLTTAFDQLDSRLLSPLYVPLLVLAVLAIDRLGATIPEPRRAIVSTAVFATMALLVLFQAGAFARHAQESSTSGPEYAVQYWSSSTLVRAAASIPDRAHVYSNIPDAVWAESGREPILFSPLRQAYRSSLSLRVPPTFVSTVGCSDTWLAWSTNPAAGDYFAPRQLAHYVDLQRVATEPDGILYRMTPRAGTPAAAAACRHPLR